MWKTNPKGSCYEDFCSPVGIFLYIHCGDSDTFRYNLKLTSAPHHVSCVNEEHIIIVLWRIPYSCQRRRRRRCLNWVVLPQGLILRRRSVKCYSISAGGSLVECPVDAGRQFDFFEMCPGDQHAYTWRACQVGEVW